ncbi:MAG: hypothetical protein U1G07_05830 [Verrucomicrobiota bacterium]
MKQKRTLKEKFAQVPHGIVTSNINQTLKLILWYLYDNTDEFAHCVSSVAYRLDLTRQCVREHFRTLNKFQVLILKEKKKDKHGLIPLYIFQHSNVLKMITSISEPGNPGFQVDDEPGNEPRNEPGNEPGNPVATNDIKSNDMNNQINKRQSSPEDGTVSKDIIDGTKKDKKLVSLSTPGLDSACLVGSQLPSGPVSLEEQIRQFSCSQLPAEVKELDEDSICQPPSVSGDINRKPVEIDVPLIDLKKMMKLDVPLKKGQGTGVRNIKLVETLNKQCKMNLDSSIKEFAGFKIVAHGYSDNEEGERVGIVLLTADNRQWVKEHRTYIRKILDTADQNQTAVFLWEQDSSQLSKVTKYNKLKAE